MFDLLPTPTFALLNFAQIWLAIPLALAFSFAYAGSRAENPREILTRGVKIAAELFFFLILVGVILYLAV